MSYIIILKDKKKYAWYNHLHLKLVYPKKIEGDGAHLYSNMIDFHNKPIPLSNYIKIPNFIGKTLYKLQLKWLR